MTERRPLSVLDAASLLFVMAIPNLIGVYLLMPVVKRHLADYQAKIASGAIPSRR